MSEQLLELKDLSLSINNQKLFSNFNFTLNAGEIAGLYAPNGTGKTTLFKLINNKKYISSDFIVEGTVLKKEKLIISNVFQQPILLESKTVIKNVTIPLENIYSKSDCEEKAKKVLSEVNLLEKAYEEVSNLSGGQKQRVSIARAFAYPADLLLLDEPLSAQDNENKENLINLIKQQAISENKGIIIISHNLQELEKVCSCIGKL